MTETELWLGTSKTGSACGSTSVLMEPTVTVTIALFHLFQAGVFRLTALQVGRNFSGWVRGGVDPVRRDRRRRPNQGRKWPWLSKAVVAGSYGCRRQWLLTARWLAALVIDIQLVRVLSSAMAVGDYVIGYDCSFASISIRQLFLLEGIVGRRYVSGSDNSWPVAVESYALLAAMTSQSQKRVPKRPLEGVKCDGRYDLVFGDA